jgi:CDP-glucose 4,6-dehydratase
MARWLSTLEGLEIMSYHSFNPLFWKDKRVFITGHTGFKGSWLSLMLKHCGANVQGYSLEPQSNQKLFGILASAGETNNEWGDVRDLKNLTRCLSEFQPEIVFHLAAQSLVRESYKNPVETYNTNIMGTVNILEASRSVKSVVAIVNVTTDKCYENQEMLWGYRENERMGGCDPYSSSKGCSELITNAMRKSFFSDRCTAFVASARAGNVIGGGDWSNDRLIPDIIHSLNNETRIILRNPKAIRPWQHVLDPLSGYMMLAEKLCTKDERYAQAWNFGPTSEGVKPVAYIVEYMLQKWGQTESWVLDPVEQPHEAQLLCLDITKAIHELGWKPKWDLTQTLNKTVDWYKAYAEGRDMYALSEKQISDYIMT